MTSPLTLAGLPRAGAISKPHDYKQNVLKLKGLLKKWVLTRNSLKISNQKNQKSQSSYGEQKKRFTWHQGQELNKNHVARRKLTEAKLKKAFRMELFELCKTRTKKSSPDLFKFYVISLGHDMANDAGRATTCRRNFKARWLQTECFKNEGPSEKMNFNGETFLRFQTKHFKNSTPPMENITEDYKTPRAKTEHEPMQAGGNKQKQKWKNPLE